MEEKKRYMYGAEIKLVIGEEEDGWGWIMSRMCDDLIESVQQYVMGYYDKILGYEVERMFNEITIRMLSGREDIINDVAGVVEEQVGAKGKIYKLQIRSPLPSENKI